MEHYLAADIGGTKTKMCLFDQNDELVETFDTVGAGFSEDSYSDVPHLSELILKIAKKYDVVSVSVNLGGKNTEQIGRVFRNGFNINDVNVFRESEAAAAIELGKSCEAEVVLLAGTGTIAIAFDENENYVVSGGWGANIGDDGSGYAIGLAAVRQSFAALDTDAPLTEMQKEITGCDRPFSKAKSVSAFRDARDAVRARRTPFDRRNIASVCHIVEKYCEKGENDALEIMRHAGLDMARLTVNTAKKLSPHNVNAVAVAGGLVRVNKFWKDEFEKYISQNSSIKGFNYFPDGVMLGTQKIAKKDFKKAKGVIK